MTHTDRLISTALLRHILLPENLAQDVRIERLQKLRLKSLLVPGLLREDSVSMGFSKPSSDR